ncbi:unnamed protein product [Lampetra planeri]
MRRANPLDCPVDVTPPFRLMLRGGGSFSLARLMYHVHIIVIFWLQLQLRAGRGGWVGAVGRAGTVAILQLVDNLAEVADGSESGDCVALSAVTPDPAPAPSTPPPPPPLPAYFPA